MPSFLSSKFSFFLLFFLCFHSMVMAIFYRNIPFRLRSTENKKERMNREVDYESIGQLLDQIEDEAIRLAAERNAAFNGDSEAEEWAAPKSRSVRLIPLRSKEEKPAQFNLHQRDKSSPTSSSIIQSHLMALRPDYAFKNGANLLRDFSDSRIERHSRRLPTNKKSGMWKEK